MPDKASGGEKTETSSTNATEIKIGDKVIPVKDIENLLSQQAAMTQESQKIAALRNTADKYGVSVEDYVRNAEGAIAITAKLMEDGTLDEHGNLVRGEVKKMDDTHVSPLNVQAQHTEVKADPRLDGLVKAVDELSKKLVDRDKDITSVMKLGLKRDIMTAHPELTDREALAVLDNLHQNPNKSVWDHAKEAVETKKLQERESEEVYAKKFGIDIDTWRKRNEQKTQGKEGASAIIGEKKLVFGSRARLHGGKEKIATPREAMVKFMNERLHSN